MTGPDALAEAFSDAVTAAAAQAGEGPELLPSRLAHAAATVLQVAGAGISLTFPGQRRLPIGASNPDAGTAERLQYTENDGPCWTAQSTDRTVVAGPHELATRWPGYAAALTESTPFTAVVSLPLDGPLTGIGTVDLYLGDTTELRRVPIAPMVAVCGLITTALVDALSSGRGAAEPAAHAAVTGLDWLATSTVQERTHIWQAMAILDGDAGISDRQALTLLQEHADTHHSPLPAIAAGVVEGTLTAQDIAHAHPAAGS